MWESLHILNLLKNGKMSPFLFYFSLIQVLSLEKQRVKNVEGEDSRNWKKL